MKEDNPILEIKNISKRFGSIEALHELSINVRKGEFLTLLGPSGCGKTTTLRIVAGLEAPDAGSIILNGSDVTSWPPNRRSVNTVFQNYALFPHMNVFSNIAYGPKLKKAPKAEISAKVEDMLKLVKLEGYGKRMPNELSGGQRQRVAIARALINEPEILLLDEPLGALDLKLRRQMQEEIKKIQQSVGITFIYITHDQEEALNMSDRIVIMNNGKVEQEGTPDEVYNHPKTLFAADFIGESNILCAVASGYEGGFLKLSGAFGVIAAKTRDNIPAGEQVRINIRTENILLDENRYGFALAGKVVSRNFTGGILKTVVELADGSRILSAGMGSEGRQYSEGEAVTVCFNPENAAVIRSAEA